jgi:hypothetical protein
MASRAIVPSIQFEFDFEKTKAALLHLAAKGLPEFDKYKACKLLFLADREHLLRLARPITGDRYEALAFGPVPSKTAELLDQMEMALKGHREHAGPAAVSLADAFRLECTRCYHPLEAADLDALSESDVVVLDEVADEHGSESFGPVADFTTKIAAYKMAWQGETGQEKFPMLFENFFADAPNGDVVLREARWRERLRKAFPDPTSE